MDLNATHRLVRMSLADQVRDFLTLEITQGHLAPGTPVKELEVAQQMGTSQTPVREAFRQLIAVGLLESRLHVGTRVRDLNERDLEETVPVRAALESLAGRLAAERQLEAPLAEAHEAIASMHALSDQNDRLAFAGASTKFHRALVAAAGNESLLRAWNALGIEILTIVAMASDNYPLSRATEDHAELLRVIESGDPEAAAQVMSQHQEHYRPLTKPSTSGEAADEGGHSH